MTSKRKQTGKTSYVKGVLAEMQVAQKYRACGFALRAQRHRNDGGEIDLIFDHGDTLYFVEVKSAKTHDQALQRLGARQIARIKQAALGFLARHDLPLNTDMRFDLALVDQIGQIKVLPGALDHAACA